MPLAGDAGKLLTRILNEVGLSEHEAFITNVVRCRPQNDRAAYAAEYKACMANHAMRDVPDGSLSTNPPKLIVLLGALPLRTILGLQKITENRGIIFDCPMFGCKAMATFAPGKVLREPNMYDTIKVDFQKARDFLLEHSTPKPVIHKELINSKERFIAWMQMFADPNITERYADIETTGTTFWKDEIASVSFVTEISNEYYGIAFLTRPKPGWWHADLNDPEIRAALQPVLKYPVDFHRGLFDVPWFWHRGYDLNFGIDTMDMHLMINENSRHKLKYLVSIHNPESSGYQLQILEEAGGEPAKYAEASPEILLDYNIEDSLQGLTLKKKFTPLVKKEGMEDFFHTMQMPLERTLTRMSYRGFMMDRQGIIDLSNKYRGQIKQLEGELFELCKQEFSYSSGSKDLPVVLYHDLKLPIIKRTEKSGAPSTDKATLDELAKIHKVPALIKQLRWYKNMLVKYLDRDDFTPIEEGKPDLGFLCHLDKNDRIHAPFLTVGTISGRPSCPKPNLLNIPKNPEIRNLFIAPPGWKLIDIDYSQAELVLLAYLAQDEVFMKAVMSSDLHTETAKGLMKSETVDDEVRRRAKNINFLKAYGGGAKKLAERLGISVEEAREWLAKWDITFPRVPTYKLEQQRKWKADNFITGLYGRKSASRPYLTVRRNRTATELQSTICVKMVCLKLRIGHASISMN
jgi:uracil-DNA glycosylase family 4